MRKDNTKNVSRARAVYVVFVCLINKLYGTSPLKSGRYKARAR